MKLLRSQKMSEDACLTKQAVYREQQQTLRRLIARLDRECSELILKWCRGEENSLPREFYDKHHNIRQAEKELERITALLGENWT